MRPATASTRLRKALPALAGCLVAMAGAMVEAQIPVQTTLHNPTDQTLIIRLMSPLKGDSSIKIVVMPGEEVKDASEPPVALAIGDPLYDYLAFKAVLPPRHRAIFTGNRGTLTRHVFPVAFTLELDEGTGLDIPNPVAGEFVYVSEASWDPEIPASVKLVEARFGPKVPFTFEPLLKAGENTTEGMIRTRALAPVADKEAKNMGSAPALPGAAAGAAAPLSCASETSPGGSGRSKAKRGLTCWCW
jgi:hypothetical protein